MAQIRTPDGWRRTHLGATLRKILGGGTPSRGDPSAWRGTIPWASVKDLKGRCLQGTEEHISQEGLAGCAANLVPAGTVVVATRMAVGRAGRFTCDVAINQDLKALFPSDDLASDFLFQWLSARESSLAAQATGSTVKGIRVSELLAAPLLLPPLPEQHKIAAILSSVDDTIEKTEAVIDQLQVVKKSMTEELLTRGIPGRHSKFRTTEIGEIPNGWALEPCHRVADRIVVGIVVKPASYYVPDGIPCLRSKNVRADRLDLADLVFISSDSNELLKKSRLSEGDVVTVRTGAPGVSCVVPKALAGANCIDLILTTPRRDCLLGDYLSRFINSSAERARRF